MGVQGAVLEGSALKAVPVVAEFRPRQSEDFGGDAELEGAEPVIDEGNDERAGEWSGGREAYCAEVCHDLYV